MKFLIIGSKNGIKKEDRTIITKLLSNMIDIKDIVFEDELLIVFFNDLEDLDFKDVILNLNADLMIDYRIYLSREYQQENIKEAFNEVSKKLKEIPYSLNNVYLDDKEILKYDLVNGAPLDYLRKKIFKKYYNDLDMLETIKTYLDCNQNMSVAAKKLYLHRNTLIQRIERFNLETNLDVRTFIDGYLIYHLL
ncbi:helix-turn-helix domain-containing protein [Acholeplasma sp. OttesenSCG-928-E16]|nr:helix-turn-helix domain-containing protein [Acholeplasma sp. OttesenSCG-928-E16]